MHYDTDKALTAKLLREKQFTIENSITELKNNQILLDEKVDDYLAKIITIPLWGVTLTVVASLVTLAFKFLTKKS